MGFLKPATVVNHKTAHKGDVQLFWDEDNWQALCAECHNRFIQSEERGGVGYSGEAGADGLPIDPKHPWYEKK